MEDPTPNVPVTGISRSEPVPQVDELEEVRKILFGQEKETISGLQQHLEDPVLHAQDVSRVLPQAVAICTTKSDQLARSITPAVESALHESVKRNPSILVDAIFPVIGPAIRKSIAETLSRLIQAVNQTLEHSFTVRGLKWRLEAARTGKSYAEVVLYHTLVYRVEQVLLIHRKTGLLLHHVGVPNTLAPDGDMVSSMLMAIQHFMEDCFRIGQGETVQTLQVGEMNVWLETGPQAVLAAVIRGLAPLELRQLEQASLEQIHEEFGPALASFQGENAPFVASGPILEACMLAQFTTRPVKSWRKPLVLAAWVLLVAGIWGFFTIRGNWRWSAYVQRLKAEDGILVTDTEKRAGRFFIVGLRDPLASDPADFLQEFKLDPHQVVSRWEPYQTLDPRFTLRRVQQRLRPPPTVSLHIQDGVLYAEGTASKLWAESARRSAEVMPGVREFNTERLFDESLAALAASLEAIEKTVVYFDETTRLAGGQEGVLAGLVAQINGLCEAAARSERRLQIAVLGHTDKKGTPEYNQLLSRQRAEQIISLLVTRGIPPTLLVPTGLGTTQPLRPNLTAAEESLNRRVSFRVLLDATAPVASPP
jgi:OOP family OmpA-OmpF porin